VLPVFLRTPKPRWPLCLRLLPPVGPDILPTSVGCEENEDRLAAQLIGEQLRNFGTVPPPSGAWELLGLPQDGSPEGFLLAPPLGAVLEQMFTGLNAVLAPPAFRVRASGRPLGVLYGQFLAGRTGRRGVCWHLPRWHFSLGRYLRLLVLSSFLLTQSRPPSTFSPSLHLVLLQLENLVLIMLRSIIYFRVRQ